jgi:hypothetical protein
MSNLYAQETWINRTENYRSGDSDVYETGFADPGDLYREFQKEYGRCTGKVHVDAPDGKILDVGWVFQKRKKYTDVNETYLLETWVTLHTAPPKRSVTYNYAELN